MISKHFFPVLNEGSFESCIHSTRDAWWSDRSGLGIRVRVGSRTVRELLERKSRDIFTGAICSSNYWIASHAMRT